MGRGSWAPILSVLLYLIDAHEAVESRFEPCAAPSQLCELGQATLPSLSLINFICKMKLIIDPHTS